MVQIEEHTLLLLDHSNGDTVSGQLILVLIESTLVETCLGVDLFDMPNSAISWTVHIWLKITLLDFEDTSLSIQHTILQLSIWKDRDIFIMDKIMKSNSFSNMQMEALNAVCMHLKVSILSNITTAHGTTILHRALLVEAMESCSSQRYKWPVTVGPSPKQKEL